MIIGITTTYEDKGNHPIERVTVEYLRSVEQAGGIPILLPPQPLPAIAIAAMLERIDGLLLTGGGDIDPAWYTTGEIAEEVTGVSSKRDEFEFSLAKAAYAVNMPTLGICRGMQVMNVAFGGSLYQDLVSGGMTKDNHVQQPPFDIMDHHVELAEDSRLSSLFGGKSEIMTNSMHHQGVRVAAPNFRFNARSADGVVEGIEDASKAFFLGVQWHPEYLASNGVLFEAFCAEADRFRR